jgi:hypothetical protein
MITTGGWTRRLGFRVIAAGFAVGALVHGAEAIAGSLGLHVREYPDWRHTLFFILDGSMAAVALWRPRILWVPLSLFLVQQTTTHGRDVWRAWNDQRDVAWFSLSTMLFLIAGAALAINHRWCGEVAEANGHTGEVQP